MSHDHNEIQKLVSAGAIEHPGHIAASIETVADLERRLKVRFPKTYREFLLAFGGRRDNFLGDHAFRCDELQQIGKDFQKYLPVIAAKSLNLFPFMHWQLESYWLFPVDEGDNPPVYGCQQRENRIILIESKFDEWRRKLVIGEELNWGRVLKDRARPPETEVTPQAEILRMAVHDNRIKSVRVMLAMGMDVNAPVTQTGSTALFWSRTKEMVAFLIRAGAEINKVDRYGSNAISSSAARGWLEAFDCLLEQQASLKCRGLHDRTLFHEAVFGENLTIVQRVLQIGFSPDVCDDEGKTPLHLAARMGLGDIAKVLLEAGANPNSRDIWGNNPAALAREGHHEELSKTLEQVL